MVVSPSWLARVSGEPVLGGLDDAHLLRYSRHLLLDEIGIEGQERLMAATVLVIGAGGLGSPAALYLAAAGVGRILLADGDRVDLTNLQRQLLHREASVGAFKTHSARHTIEALNSSVALETIDARLEGEALSAAVARADVVLDCSDQFATRHAVNRACVEHRRPLVAGSALRFDGQLAVFDPRVFESPCYHCVFPASADVLEQACATLGIFAPLTGLVGTLQASEAIKLIAGFGPVSTQTLWLIDGRRLAFDPITIARDPACAVCGQRAGSSKQGPLRPTHGA